MRLSILFGLIFHTRWDFADLTHWGRVTHICVGNLTINGSDNGLSPGQRQAIIWTNAGILLIGPLGTNFSEILAEIITFSFKKMYLKVLSAKWQPFCLGLNVLNMLLLVIAWLTSASKLCDRMKCSTLLIWGWQHDVIGNFSSVDILMACTLCQCNIMTFLYNLIGAGARSLVYLSTNRSNPRFLQNKLIFLAISSVISSLQWWFLWYIILNVAQISLYFSSIRTYQFAGLATDGN